MYDKDDKFAMKTLEEVRPLSDVMSLLRSSIACTSLSLQDRGLLLLGSLWDDGSAVWRLCAGSGVGDRSGGLQADRSVVVAYEFRTG